MKRTWMRIVVVAGVCAAMALTLVGCDRGSSSVLSSRQLSELADEAVTATCEDVVLEDPDGEYETYYEIYWSFYYSGDTIESGQYTWGNSFTVDDEDDYDDVVAYVDDQVEVTTSDGAEASIADVEEGDELEVVMDSSGMLVSIVIQE